MHADASTAASSNVTMVAVGSVPVPDLAGPSGDFPDDQRIDLNATASYDPDTLASLQQLSFSWACRREDHPTPCFTGTQ
jgi:hypothetical protein